MRCIVATPLRGCSGQHCREIAALIADFYFGVGSRYSYLASTQLAALEAETGVKFNWLAVDSAQLIAAAHGGRSPFAGTNGSGQYDWGYRQKDAEAWAAFYGVPFREPHGRLALDPNLLSLACTAARGLGVAEAYAHALLRAVFADDLPAVDRAVCIACASRVGLDRDAFATALDDENTWKERERVTAKAIEQGAFGVPTFVVNQRLFWGNDRIVLLRHALLQTGPF
ncbi:2-hydroxychromene-2-carboxylate isomerase [Novosphingobium sp. LASN5T]|nr:2-hydroxychromene-2-carboxylate isomerase [Novosphingobium sp. LASN5T]